MFFRMNNLGFVILLIHMNIRILFSYFGFVIMNKIDTSFCNYNKIVNINICYKDSCGVPTFE